MHGETRRKARRRYPGDEALRRVSPRRRRERRRRERERGRDPEHRAELPRVPSAALFRAEAGRNLSGHGGFDRAAARRRICIRQAAAWTEKPPAQKGEHGCPKQSRTLTGKPASSTNYNTKHGMPPQAQNLRLRERTKKSAPMRTARTHETPITIANALPCCWNGSGMFMP